MLMLLMAVTTSWAFEPGEAITDMSLLKEGDYVLIKNVGRQKYAYENPGNRWIGNGAEATDLTYAWQVHIEEGGKYSFSSVIGYYIPTPLDGQAMYTVAATDETKDEFTFTAHPDDNTKWLVKSTNANIYWDGQASQFVGWAGNGTNSQFEILSIEVSSVEIDEYLTNALQSVKDASKAEVQLLATATNLYPAAETTLAAIEAVTLATTTPAYVAIEEVKALVASYKKAAYQALEGKYFSIMTPARDNGYLEMGASQVNGAASLASPAATWKFVENNGKVNIYNEYTNKYLCEPAGNSATVAVTADQASAGAYDLIVNSTDSDEDGAVIKLTSNGKSVHVAGGGALVRWDNGGASEYNVVELADTDIASIAETYKATVLATLENWATLTVVFDAALIDNAKTAINAVTSTGFEACAAYDAELKKVTDAVAAKMFTFQTTATDANRNGVWVSANASTMKAIGADTQDYNAIWSLRHAAGTSFYMYNELNSVYMGAPSSNCPLTTTPSVAYTFEIVDAENGIVEMHTNGETMHASNHTDDKLLNWDGNEAASRWYIRTIDVAADIQTILDGLTEADYAEVPALGQYPKAAYDALVEARTSARTVAEVEAAIAAFNKTKNIPVYFIRSAHNGYAAGSAIYYDGAWKWKTANKYDKQMWMTIPAYAQANVPAVDAYDSEGTSYEICDYLTGTVMRGKSVQIVKINGLDNAYNLQYNADANSTDAAQHAKDTKDLVNWKPATATDALASAWYVDYLGTSFELDQLTDEKIAALAALQTAYNAKAFYADAVMGDGLGEYTGDRDAIVAVLPAAETIGAKTLAEQAVLSIDDINAATDALNNVTALAINLPVQGKYYRIKGACDATPANYYITGNTNADGGRIACKAEADASTIFYYNDGKLLAYNSGVYIGVNGSNYKFSSVDGTTPATAIEFAGSPRQAGAYTVKSADRFLYYKVYNGEVEIDRNQNNNSDNLDWTLEEVTELPVTVTAAGYATLYAPVALTVPADGVKAYTVSINEGGWADLNEIASGVIPANTGVVLAGEGSHSFAITTAAAFEGENALEGTVAATNVTKDAYVLGYINVAEEGEEEKKEVGFYTATKNQVENTAWKNNSHKAYLPKPEGSNAVSYSFRFGEGTTGISEVKGENGNVKAIYDLTGRRVENISAPGIYIVGGKKVLVK